MTREKNKAIKRAPREKNKEWRANRVPLTILMVIFFLYTLTLIFPFAWLLFNSVKDKVEFFLNPWNAPEAPFRMLKNYVSVFGDFNMVSMFLNTIFLATLSPIISLFFTSCAAYAYARHRFKLRGVLYALAITPMVVCVAGTQPATYRLVNDIGIYDSLPGILLMSTGGFGFNFLLLSSVFSGMSGAYKEAAQIDGAGRWRIFLTIYLPQASGMLAALYVLAFIASWNNYETPYLYLPSHETLATGIYMLSLRVGTANSSVSNDYPKLFAAMTISIVPVLVLFIVFQKKIMSFSLSGGIKG